MEITSLAQEGSTLHLLLMLIALTLFYAALLWLPVRGTTALLRVLRQAVERKDTNRKRPARLAK